ncbi:MAG: hypothetical protein NC311_18930 [Muribaculaceae bacterium]|nr:hypothetical protein [Muribaculaceae bacterium]
MATLISINKPHTDNIFVKRTKEIEYRKHPLPLGKHYCYETKRKGGCGKVIGEFEVYDYREYKLISDIPPIIRKLGAVDASSLEEYAAGKPIYANFIRNVVLYETPKKLGNFSKPCSSAPTAKCYPENCERCPWNVVTRPPQSYCRVEEVTI